MNDGADAGATASRLASRFVAARREARSLPAYPGSAPTTLAEAYAVQDAAIDLWPDEIAGWKIGLIPPGQREIYGAARIAGPIFRADVQEYQVDAIATLPVFSGGFGAVEAEFVFRMARDAPHGVTDWSHEDAVRLVDALFIGVENAGSPLATINDLGAAVTASDFGNNAGLIIGAEVADWRQRDLATLTAETFIDGQTAGSGDAARIPGTPIAALTFILGHAAARGRPLRAGQFVSTGAVTGVHQISAGQSAEASFGAFGIIRCRAEAATARARGPAPPGRQQT